MNPLFKAFVFVHVRLYRLTKGRLGGSIVKRPVVLLTTTGRKTGKARTTPLASFEDGGDLLIVASFGGAPKNPAWFTNLRANPEVTVQLRGRVFRAKAEAVAGEERARLWKMIVEQAPVFGGYERKAVGREIPVVRLKELH
jgi:F420H(2)-dependent quinone reductase